MIDTRPVSYGKHKGLTPEDIAEIDPGYIVWLVDNVSINVCSPLLYRSCVDILEALENERDEFI